MNVEYLLRSEKTTVDETLGSYADKQANLMLLINLFFKLSHFINEDVEIESIDNNFQVLAYSTYLQLPYTLKTIHDLWLKGYYLESLTILRHIIEGFVKLRYFANHRDEIPKHINGERRIPFRKMFDEAAPGYYIFHYGKMLSDFAHGGFKAYLLRVEYYSQTEGRVKTGCEFDAKVSGIVIFQTITFCFAFLNYLDVFFPTILSRLNGDICKERDTILSNLKLKMSGNRGTKEQQKEWESVILPFISKQ